MAKVVAGMMMSLDGFVNDRDGNVAILYPDADTMRESASIQEAMRATGAVIMGRRSYEMGNGDFTGYEFQTPIFVVTHRAPERAAKGENAHLTFTFVTDGVASAVTRAKAAAGEKDVTIVGGPSIIQQCLNAGLIDELHLDVSPVLLGGGLRLFDRLETAGIALEQIAAGQSSYATELRYRVVR